ncbi:MAG: hypothetical protein IT577_06985 [Verrucomicrobiae bacterium]|nr:hypothetical protein [Verrucomicrobiae bacterium]
MRATLAALSKGCLGALLFWCLGLAALLACAAAATCSFFGGWCYAEHLRSRQALATTIARLADRGEVIGLAPAPDEPGPSDPGLARASEILRSLSSDFAIGRSWPKCRELLGAGTARVAWRGESAPSRDIPLSWDDVACQLEMAHETLEEIRALLDTGEGRVATAADEASDRSIAPWLAWSAMDRLHNLDTPGAVCEVARIRRLADRHRERPTLDGQLWRCALLKGAVRLSWEVLQAPALDPETLRALDALWAEDRPLAGVASTLRRERSAGLGAFAAMIRSMETDVHWKTHLEHIGQALAERPDLVAGAGEATAWLRYGAWRLLWADEEMARFLDTMQDLIDLLERDPGHVSWRTIRATWAAAEGGMSGQPSRMGLDRLVIGSGGLNGGRAACQVILEYEAERRMLLADVARARFELEHGETPSDLGRLVPAYLPSVPVDPMDGSPMRFRLNPRGEPVMYSVGPDCRDDDGDAERPDAKPAAALSHCRDMVWPIPDFARSTQ